MVEVRCTGERIARWMRYIARAVVLAWGVWWTSLGLALGIIILEIQPPGELLLVALPGLIMLLSAAIAWRWEAIGAVVLILEGLFALIISYPMIMSDHFRFRIPIFVLLTMAPPPLVAGFLFFASWWGSRKLRISESKG